MPPTPKQALLEVYWRSAFPTRRADLAADINDMIVTGSTWRQVARIVEAQTGQTVSYESLRSWYGKSTAA